MPTSKPRIQVTLPTPQYDLLRRLAELQQRPMAAIVAELIDGVYPVLERVAVVLQAATRAQESMKDGLRVAIDQAERDTRPFLAGALGQLDLLSMDIDRAVAADAGAPAGSPPTAKGPRLVTRGSGLPPRTHRTVRKRPPTAPKSGRKAAKRAKRS